MSQLRYSTRPPVPIDALRLNEDIRALDDCRNMLDTVDPANITQDKDFGWDILRLLQNELRVCQRYAENKMRKEYLAPSKRKIGKHQ